MQTHPKFCTECGHATELKIPPDDTRPRACCDNCGWINYINPKVVCGVIFHHEDQVLLCKRAIEPRLGYWTFPAGFMECEESTKQGALREAIEEAGATPRSAPVFYANYSLPRISQVYSLYRAELDPNAHTAGPESLETRMVKIADLSQYELAFGIIEHAVGLLVDDMARGEWAVHDCALGGTFDRPEILEYQRLALRSD